MHATPRPGLRSLVIAPLLALSLLLGVSPALAQKGTAVGPLNGEEEEEKEPEYIWLYVDNGGQMHFVDSLASVPEGFRNRAQKTTVKIREVADTPAPATNRAKPKTKSKSLEDAVGASSAPPTVRKDSGSADAAKNGDGDRGAAKSNKERLADMVAERDAISTKIALLEEGSFEVEDEGTDVGALERNLDAMEKRLDVLDAEIKKLQR